MCSLCQGNVLHYPHDPRIVRINYCKHLFHVHCLNIWINRSLHLNEATCPECHQVVFFKSCRHMTDAEKLALARDMLMRGFVDSLPGPVKGRLPVRPPVPQTTEFRYHAHYIDIYMRALADLAVEHSGSEKFQAYVALVRADFLGPDIVFSRQIVPLVEYSSMNWETNPESETKPDSPMSGSETKSDSPMSGFEPKSDSPMSGSEPKSRSQASSRGSLTSEDQGSSWSPMTSEGRSTPDSLEDSDSDMDAEGEIVDL
ncbi:hypothetical protein P154DRAFT_536375 [Amniculicola lignicola CBS 123094]|uniref:RING-type domain-containing protein n=1 Tax=Amniculicola lignicola CBS 123094 TaxID=1392246 RepID=A0A6A5WL39_9PLEO|nr:hypothetical protein P154DRAFT_536375 [Amniculicola lignicola CBS 123094]